MVVYDTMTDWFAIARKLVERDKFLAALSGRIPVLYHRVDTSDPGRPVHEIFTGLMLQFGDWQDVELSVSPIPKDLADAIRAVDKFRPEVLESVIERLKKSEAAHDNQYLRAVSQPVRYRFFQEAA